MADWLQALQHHVKEQLCGLLTVHMCMRCYRGGTLGLRRELPSRNVSESDLERLHLETSGASFTSFNSEEGFGSPAAHRNKDRPNVFDMDDNDLKVQSGAALHKVPLCFVVMQCHAISGTTAQKAFSSSIFCTHAELAPGAGFNQHSIDTCTMY